MGAPAAALLGLLVCTRCCAQTGELSWDFVEQLVDGRHMCYMLIQILQSIGQLLTSGARPVAGGLGRIKRDFIPARTIRCWRGLICLTTYSPRGIIPRGQRFKRQ